MSNTDFVKKLMFRSSHRGTKEMDLILGGFFKNNHSSLLPADLDEFERLLEFSDKVLTDYFVMNISNHQIEDIGITKKIKSYLERQ